MLSAALLCLSLNVFHESRGEPLEGQLAVAYVTHHRAAGKPKNYCQVVYAPGQFSWTANKPKTDKSSEEWKRAVAVAKSFRYFPDETNGATFYHATSVSPKWRHSKFKVKKIGQHVFYKEVKA